jgi:hypothetical protein
VAIRTPGGGCQGRQAVRHHLLEVGMDVRDVPAQRTTVDLTDTAERRYWCRRFGVRTKDLKRAMRSVGNDPGDVENYLGPGKTGPNDASHWRATSGL